ncbi:SNF2 family N-terminal domain-containing protein [Hypoxylon crocopeplum]|nr:SNF2 family N-terminal domain-containing protein [Hypoxylon crocopeplum]
MYYNPHFLHVQEVFGHYVAETPLLPLGMTPPTMGSGACSLLEASRSQVDEDTEVNSILNSLSHHAVLQRQIAIKGLKTPLKDHQMEAIDFILRREVDSLPPELALWRELESDAGDVIYQHIISGTRRQTPAESKGGILADEMGLGKTMVALSTIAASSDRAFKFASENLQSNDEQNSPRLSRATLVIVPSSLLIDGWIDEIRNGRNILGNVTWFRIILDEVVTNLRAQYRWCLTGTPIQNSLDDLGALVTFIKVPLLDDPMTFRRFIVNESKSGTRERFKNLGTLLGSICLRRTKDVVGLSDPTEQIRRLEFTPSEREEYNNMLSRCRSRIDMYVSNGSKGVSSAMLQSLLQLRLYCNHGKTGHPSQSTSCDPDEVLSYLQQMDQALFVCCSRTIYSINDIPGTDGGSILSSCSHLVCRDCQPQQESRPPRCPQCNPGIQSAGVPPLLQDMRSMQIIQTDRSSEINGGFECPTKLKAFLKDIQQQEGCKSIVFSSWKKTLDLIGELLKSKGLPYYCIHGSLPLEGRRRVLHEYEAEGGANILLMTLGTGAVGLNLAVATRVYLLEPQWNPSVEKQAFGRAVRLGQREQVTIIRYIMKNTVEDTNILSRQINKLRLASGGFEQRSRGGQSDRIEALRNQLAA